MFFNIFEYFISLLSVSGADGAKEKINRVDVQIGFCGRWFLKKNCMRIRFRINNNKDP